MKTELLLDNVRSASNIGSLFRTCDAFAISHIYLCGICATPPNREMLKTALGATETVSWSHHTDTLSLIAELKQSAQHELFAVEQAANSVPLDQFVPNTNKKTILILGNEVDGVSKEVLEVVDGVIEIPQFGSKKSLNVSVAGGLALWHVSHIKRLNNSKA